ncbi:transposase family protein [Streptomyces chartreusis]
MAGVITASEPSWIAPFSGLSPRTFRKLITALRRDGVDPVRKGQPWSLPLEDRVLLVAASWRSNLTLRQRAPLFGVSKSAADRIIGHLGPAHTLQQRKRFRKDAVLIADGNLVPTRDHTIAEQSKNYRYSINHQVVIADGGYRGTGLVIPHRSEKGQSELPDRKEEHNAWHRKVRARVEHVFVRMKGWKILRNCRLKGDGVHHAMLGIARLHNLVLAG